MIISFQPEIQSCKLNVRFQKIAQDGISALIKATHKKQVNDSLSLYDKIGAFVGITGEEVRHAFHVEQSQAYLILSEISDLPVELSKKISSKKISPKHEAILDVARCRLASDLFGISISLSSYMISYDEIFQGTAVKIKEQSFLKKEEKSILKLGNAILFTMEHGLKHDDVGSKRHYIPPFLEEDIPSPLKKLQINHSATSDFISIPTVTSE